MNLSACKDLFDRLEREGKAETIVKEWVKIIHMGEDKFIPMLDFKIFYDKLTEADLNELKNLSPSTVTP